MSSVLITAFEPYDRWPENSSWLCLMELTRDLPSGPAITTRRYPVDYATVRTRLARDLQANYDVAIHLGQAPGSGRIQLEAIALNVGGTTEWSPDVYQPLENDGPVAYRTRLPVADWTGKLREAGIPAEVSYHAGTYLCNATSYWSHYLAERHGLATRSLFVHLPLEQSQVVSQRQDYPSLPATTTAAAVRLILGELS